MFWITVNTGYMPYICQKKKNKLHVSVNLYSSISSTYRSVKKLKKNRDRDKLILNVLSCNNYLAP